jgi:hypothetical protein
VSPVKYELGFYIPEDNNLHSDRRELLKLYTAFKKAGCYLFCSRMFYLSFNPEEVDMFS